MSNQDCDMNSLYMSVHYLLSMVDDHDGWFQSKAVCTLSNILKPLSLLLKLLKLTRSIKRIPYEHICVFYDIYGVFPYDESVIRSLNVVFVVPVWNNLLTGPFITRYQRQVISGRRLYTWQIRLYMVSSSYSLSVWGGLHDDVIKRKHCPCYWPFVRGIHRWIPSTKASDAELLWFAPE